MNLDSKSFFLSEYQKIASKISNLRSKKKNIYYELWWVPNSRVSGLSEIFRQMSRCFFPKVQKKNRFLFFLKYDKKYCDFFAGSIFTMRPRESVEKRILLLKMAFLRISGNIFFFSFFEKACISPNKKYFQLFFFFSFLEKNIQIFLPISLSIFSVESWNHEMGFWDYTLSP